MSNNNTQITEEDVLLKLDDFARTPLTPEEEGGALINRAALFANIEGKIAGKVHEDIKDTVELLAELDELESEFNEAVQMGDLRKKLQS